MAQRDRLYRLDRDSGELLWEHSFATKQSFNTSHKRRPQPLIWGDYVLHVTEGRRVLKALDLASGNESGRFYAFSPED